MARPPRRIVRRRAVARGAVVAGTAYAAGRSSADRRRDEEEQSAGYAAPQAQAYAQPPQPSLDMTVEQLNQLAGLKERGVLTEEEFTAQKRRILGS